MPNKSRDVGYSDVALELVCWAVPQLLAYGLELAHGAERVVVYIIQHHPGPWARPGGS